MDSYTQFQLLLSKWIGFVGSIMGNNILRKDFKITAHSIFVLIICAPLPIWYIWTIYAFPGDLAFGALGYFGVGCDVAMKSVFPFIQRTNTQTSIDFLDHVYGQNLKSVANKVTFDNFMWKLGLCIKLIFFNYTACVVSFTVPPVIIYIFTGSIDPIVPIILPGTEPDSTSGFAISTLYQCVALVYSWGVYIYFDALFAFQMLHVILLCDIIRNKIQEINRLVSIHKSSQVEIKIKFRNLLMIHNEMITYVNNLGTTYFYPIAIVALFSTQSIGTNIFASFVLNVVPVSLYVMITALLFQLCYYCAIGTIVEFSYDRLYKELITSKWYLLPKSCQKDMLLLLSMANRPSGVTIGNILPLNMDTYLILLKRIYSFTMVLNSFIN